MKIKSSKKMSFLGMVECTVIDTHQEIISSVYKKLIHSGQYLNFCSIKPFPHKLTVIHTLIHSAKHY